MCRTGAYLPFVMKSYFFFFLIKRKSILAVADVTENSFYKQIHVVKVEAGLKAGVVPVLEAV